MKQHRVFATPVKNALKNSGGDDDDGNKENENPVQGAALTVNAVALFPPASFKTPVNKRTRLLPTGVYVKPVSLARSVASADSIMESGEECKYKRRRCNCSMFNFATNPHGWKQTCEMCMKSKRELLPEFEKGEQIGDY